MKKNSVVRQVNNKIFNAKNKNMKNPNEKNGTKKKAVKRQNGKIIQIHEQFLFLSVRYM